MTEPVFPEITFTKNTLYDLVSLIRQGNVVALHTTEACRVFHKISELSLDVLDKTRVVYIDCNAMPGLLGEGEWEWYIKHADREIQELPPSSDVRLAIINQTVTHRFDARA